MVGRQWLNQKVTQRVTFWRCQVERAHVLEVRRREPLSKIFVHARRKLFDELRAAGT